MTAILLVWAVWAFSGLSNSNEDKTSSLLKASGLLRANDKVIVAQGKKLFATTCAACHGVNLEGEENWQDPNPDGTLPAPPHDKDGHTWHHKDQLLFDLTKFGLAKYLEQPDYNTNMPVYDGVLRDDEIIAVLSYIKSTWPKDIQNNQSKLNK